MIRLRHWAEESGGRLERVYRQKGRFELYRMLLSLMSRLAIVVVFFCAFRLTHSPWISGSLSLLMVSDR